LFEAIVKVFPDVELRKSSAVSVAESDSLLGAAKKLLKALKGQSADRVHEQPKQWNIGEKFRWGQVEVTLISADAQTFRLKLPSGDVAVVPASVDLTLAESDPSAFALQISSIGSKSTGTTFESLMQNSILADDGELSGTV
jgi:hypothetical protein